MFAPEYKDANVHSVQFDTALNGGQLLDTWEEFDDGITHSIQSVFPNLGIQLTLNSLAVSLLCGRAVSTRLSCIGCI